MLSLHDIVGDVACLLDTEDCCLSVAVHAMQLSILKNQTCTHKQCTSMTHVNSPGA